MSRTTAILMAIGCCVAAQGCAMNNCGRGYGPGLVGNRRCTDCAPCWVPSLKYCAFIDDLVTCETGKNCGIRALARYRRQCRHPLSADFAAGFVQAYVDLAEGRGPLPPNRPPSRYWTAYYRSCVGQPRVEEWFAGYNVGLEDGRNSGVSQFSRIDIRPAGCPVQPR